MALYEMPGRTRAGERVVGFRLEPSYRYLPRVLSSMEFIWRKPWVR